MQPTRPTRRDVLAHLAGAAALLAAPEGAAARLIERLSQDAMPTREIPGTSETLPIIGLGSSKPVLEIPEEGVEPLVAVIRMLVERGGRVVDTSPRSEDIDVRFGRVLQRPEFRDRLFVATKINTPDAEVGVGQMRQNQRLFGRRTVDLVQIESLRGLEHHWPRLLEWKESGEARYIGVTVSSYQNHEPLETFMRREQPDFVHVNYSVIETRAEERILPLARDGGVAVLINRPFMNGTYFGRVTGRALPAWVADFDCHAWSQFSLKYILAHPAVTCVLTETTNPEHMEENVDAAFGRLPDEATRRRMRELAQTL
jgi:diketogulonate reductase-like aldo/keto reductase